MKCVNTECALELNEDEAGDLFGWEDYWVVYEGHGFNRVNEVYFREELLCPDCSSEMED